MLAQSSRLSVRQIVAAKSARWFSRLASDSNSRCRPGDKRRRKSRDVARSRDLHEQERGSWCGGPTPTRGSLRRGNSYIAGRSFKRFGARIRLGRALFRVRRGVDRRRPGAAAARHQATLVGAQFARSKISHHPGGREKFDRVARKQLALEVARDHDVASLDAATHTGGFAQLDAVPRDHVAPQCPVDPGRPQTSEQALETRSGPNRDRDFVALCLAGGLGLRGPSRAGFASRMSSRSARSSRARTMRGCWRPSSVSRPGIRIRWSWSVGSDG